MTGANKLASSPKQIAKTAPSRGLSPVRSLSTSPQMSPVTRPKSPLSSRYEPPAQFEQMRPHSPRTMSTRPAISQRRGNSNSLKLPSLPRFHPSNFASTHSSLQPTPDSGQASPQAPLSPRQPHHRTISDAQKQLLAYQREMVSAAARSSTPVQLDGPESPRLMPMGSPGPVTPLQLESEEGGYLAVGVDSPANQAIESHELVERLVTEEAARQRRSGSRQSNR